MRHLPSVILRFRFRNPNVPRGFHRARHAFQIPARAGSKGIMAQNDDKTAQSRVNIVYHSKEDERSEVELPFKVLVMGDFTRAEDGTPMNERESIPVTRDNLDAVMRALSPRVDISVRDILRGEDDSRIPVRLRFESLEDFTPKRLVQRIAPLQEATALRRRLLEARRALSERPELAKELEELLASDDVRARLRNQLAKGHGSGTGGLQST
jgi:type VI secretion system protein ImpB